MEHDKLEFSEHLYLPWRKFHDSGIGASESAAE